ncbi:Gfo/Idh/MocA family oxidoreductase, partial [bacterium]|nr:Gfo/Idh/MocA family oxidoreductase [bacterium]
MKIVSIGGYGHSIFVFDEILQIDEAKLVAFAPAFDGEDLSIITSHKIYNDNILYYDNYEEMLEKEKPDVVIVSTRLDKIAKIAIDSANKGCHLICEKPLAINYRDLENLHNTVKKNNVKLMAMLSMRAEPVFVAAREIYQSGKIGEAVLINSRKSYKWGTRPEWFGDKSKYGGTIGWIGIHALDFINFITELDFVSVAAMQSNFSHPERKDCDDNCALILEMSNGGHATVSVDFFRPKAA